MIQLARRIIWLALAVAASTLLFHATVRANAPAGRYTVSSGTVFDNKTKLTWQQTPASSAMTGPDAKTYCAGVSSTLGGSGWRLPTEKELLTLVDYSQAAAPLIDPSAFPGTPASFFWSSTPLAASPGRSLYVDFSTGLATYPFSASDTAEARCVH
jgi:hypothetical protein